MTPMTERLMALAHALGRLSEAIPAPDLELRRLMNDAGRAYDRVVELHVAAEAEL